MPTPKQLASFTLSVVSLTAVTLGIMLSVYDPFDGPMPDPGEQVMIVLPSGEGHEWQGPFTIISRDAERVVVDINGSREVFDSSQTTPLAIYRQSHTDRSEER